MCIIAKIKNLIILILLIRLVINNKIYNNKIYLWLKIQERKHYYEQTLHRFVEEAHQ